MGEHSDEIPRDVGKLWGAFRTLEGTLATFREWGEGKVNAVMLILTGVDGSNGIRGDVRELKVQHERLEGEVRRLEKWGSDLWNIERPANCLGEAAVARLREDIETQRVADTNLALEMRKLRTTTWSVLAVALIGAASSIAVAVITRGGKP